MRGKIVMVRFNDAEHADICAKAEGLALATYIRRAACEAGKLQDMTVEAHTRQVQAREQPASTPKVHLPGETGPRCGAFGARPLHVGR